MYVYNHEGVFGINLYKSDSKRSSVGNLVVVTGENGACPSCAGYMGKILFDDISGGDSVSEYAAGYETLSSAIENGLFHPNCRCGVVPYTGDGGSSDYVSSEELLLYSLNALSEQQIQDSSAIAKGFPTTEKTLEILSDLAATIDNVSNTYDIDKALLMAVLFEAIRFSDASDTLADERVIQTKKYRDAVEEYNSLSFFQQIFQGEPQRTVSLLDDTPTGIGNISAKASIEAFNWLNEVTGNGERLDYNDKDSRFEEWKDLKENDEYNVAAVGAALLYSAAVDDADINSGNKSDVTATYNAYKKLNNAAKYYVTDLYDYYEQFKIFDGAVNGGDKQLDEWDDYAKKNEDKETLSLGSKGENVEELQRLLNSLGYRDNNGNMLGVDGSFGPKTLEAVNNFKNDVLPGGNQGENRGVVGPTTWGYLENAKSAIHSDHYRNDDSREVYYYNDYNVTFEEALNIQNSGISTGYYGGKTNMEEIEHYLDPNNRDKDYYIYQFLNLSTRAGISEADLAKFLEGKGILEGMANVYLYVAEKHNMNEAYLLAHSLLETGNGTSKLANGIEVNGVIVYNMFGIGAYDDNADKYGSEYAYKMGWDTPEKAIEGGASWISRNYINSTKYQQDTLYKMRWNPELPGVHQYASDVGWAVKQTYNIKKVYDVFPNAFREFDIPNYK